MSAITDHRGCAVCGARLRLVDVVTPELFRFCETCTAAMRSEYANGQHWRVATAIKPGHRYLVETGQ